MVNCKYQRRCQHHSGGPQYVTKIIIVVPSSLQFIIMMTRRPADKQLMQTASRCWTCSSGSGCGCFHSPAPRLCLCLLLFPILLSSHWKSGKWLAPVTPPAWGRAIASHQSLASLGTMAYDKDCFLRRNRREKLVFEWIFGQEPMISDNNR